MAFFFLFFMLDLAFLMLGIAYVDFNADGTPNTACLRAGGAFGILSAFAAWYVCNVAFSVTDKKMC